MADLIKANLPALIEGTTTAVGPALLNPAPGASSSEACDPAPPIEVIVDTQQLKERIIDYLGAVLARCWIDRELLDKIEASPHRTLRHLGILLPEEIDIKVERANKSRPRLVIYEYNQERTYRRRICYLQLIMVAGK